MGGAAIATLVVMPGSPAAFAQGRGFFGGYYQQQWQPYREPPRQHATVRRKTEAQTKKEPPPKPLMLPLIEISISDQKLTLYDKGAEVARAPVSTGMAGHLTPTGVFSVIEKELFHRSNIYSGAPMPFMQRITWSGVALHAGVLPGYPASHGCIRMPPEFATRLYRLTERGARVLVMNHAVAPVPFENPRLFERAAPEEKTSVLEAPAPTQTAAKAPAAVRTAQSQTSAVMNDSVDTISAAKDAKDESRDTAAQDAAKDTKDAVTETANDAVNDVTKEVTKDAVAGTAQEGVAAAPAPEKTETAATADAPKATAPAATQDEAKDVAKDLTKDVTKDLAQDAAKNETKDATQDETKDARNDQTAAQAPKATTPAGGGESATGTVVVKPVTITAPQPIEVQKTFVPTAVPGNAPAMQTVQPAAPVKAAKLRPYGPERPLRPGAITVFVSKKEGKLFVRKGFQPIYSSPVTIANPELPLGTHLFTAVEQNPDGHTFRWLLVSLPPEAASRKAEVHVSRDKHGRRIEKIVQPAAVLPAATAAEALERVEIPPLARERIAELMSPGASLIISDQGLGHETGIETDFIVLTR